MKEQAKFIGKDGSCGLINGKVYTVKLRVFNGSNRLYLYVNGDIFGIPYDTVHALVKNWDFTV